MEASKQVGSYKPEHPLLAESSTVSSNVLEIHPDSDYDEKPWLGLFGGYYLEILLVWALATVPMLALAGCLIVMVQPFTHHPSGSTSFYSVENNTRLPLGTAFYSNTPAAKFVFIASLSSTLATVLIPAFLLLLSYPIARGLARESDLEYPKNLPSPYQLKLLIGFLDGKITTLWPFSRYIFGSKKKRVAIVPILGTAAALLTGITLLTICVAIADAWLHNRTITVDYTIMVPAPPNADIFDTFSPGRGLSRPCLSMQACNSNSSCAAIGVLPDCVHQQDSILGGDVGSTLLNSTEYAKIEANISQINKIDRTSRGSIITSASFPSEVDFEAETSGSSTTCGVVTQFCNLSLMRLYVSGQPLDQKDVHFDCNAEIAGLDLQGNFSEVSSTDLPSPETDLTYMGFDQGYKFFNSSQKMDALNWQAINWMNPNLWWGFVFQVDSELAPSAFVFSSIDFNVIGNDDSITDITNYTNFRLVEQDMDMLGGILSCNTVLSTVNYSMIDGIIENTSWTTMNHTAPVPFLISWADHHGTQLRQGIQQAVATADTIDDIGSSFAAAFDDTMLSLVAGTLSERPPLSIDVGSTTQVTRAERAPFLFVVLLDFLYAAISTVLMIVAIVSVRLGSGVKDAQARLSVQAIVAESFESPSWGDDAKDVDELYAERRGRKTRRVALVKRKGGGRKYKQVVTPQDVEKH